MFLVAMSLSVAGPSACGPTCPSQSSGCGAPTTLMIPLPAGTPQVYDIALSFRTGDDEETDRCLAILPPPEDWSGNLPVTCVRNSASGPG